MYFRSIAFSGGGVRGGLHVGSVAAIEELYGNLQFPEGVYGSSIGAIVATAVAFGLNSTQIQCMFDKNLQLSAFLPPLRLTSIQNFAEKKGMFSMDMMEESIVAMFQEHGVDLKHKTCADASQKLYIVASNLTRGKPTLFTGAVPVLQAIRCSCCLPFVFEPQVMYNQVYVDGGIQVHYLHKIVPENSLVLHISQVDKPFAASDVTDASIMAYIGSIYGNIRKEPLSANTLWLQNSTIGILQELTPEDKKLLFDQGYSQTLRFLSKFISKKLE